MKIVCISHSGGLRAGAEISFLEMVRGLAIQGHIVHAVLPQEGELSAQLGEYGISYTVIPFSWWVTTRKSLARRFQRLLNLPLACLHLTKIFKRMQPDLVVTNTMTIGAGAFASKWCNIPHVWYIHEFGREDHGFRFDLGERLSYFLIDKLSKRIIVNSKAVFESLQKKISSAKLRVVHYAVEISKPDSDASRSDKEFKLILVGRMVPSKGQEEAIGAVSLLVKKGLPVRLVLLGGGDPEYRAVLQKLVQTLELTSHIHFAAFSNDPFTHLLSSDVALVCSKREAFGRVTVEAMKLGLPVIGANCAGTTELIDHGVNGLLYEPGNVVDLSRKIERLYHNRDVMNEMGIHARKWSNSEFTTQKYITGLLSVFEEVLTPDGVRPVLNEAISGD